MPGYTVQYCGQNCCSQYCSSRISSYFCNIARNKFLPVSTICKISCNSVTQISVFSQSNLKFKFNRWAKFPPSYVSSNIACNVARNFATIHVATSSKKYCKQFYAQCCTVYPGLNTFTVSFPSTLTNTAILPSICRSTQFFKCNFRFPSSFQNSGYHRNFFCCCY